MGTGAVTYTIPSIWRENVLRYFSAKTMNPEEQIMSKDKHSSIFPHQRETIVFIILQMFFATRAVLKTWESRGSENI